MWGVQELRRVTVYIRLSAQALHGRILKAKTQRPLFRRISGAELLEKIKKQLRERETCYGKAQHTVEGLGITQDKLSGLFAEQVPPPSV